MKAIKDLLQRIRTDRKNRQGTWIGIDESHIILNALEKSEQLQTEIIELRARLDRAGELPCEVGDTLIIEADKLPEGCVPRFYCSVGGKEIDITEYVHEDNFSTEE